ncbi:MAG: hypothetical protein MJZ26_08280 [Fibrobacter sp.]|nr:hypothetical protein [Fibrobacter sp.]
MLKKIAAFSFPFLMLAGCSSDEVTVSYKVSEPTTVKVVENGFFSTIDEQGEERVGTEVKVFTEMTYSNAGDTIKAHRKYVMNDSRGYLKNYMPSELAWRVQSVDLAAIDREVLSIDGLLEGYDSLVEKTPMPKKWKEELLNPEFKPHLKRLEKQRWEMEHLLSGTVPTKGNITQLLKDQGRLNYALIKIDSVVVKGFENRDHRRCLDYVVYMQDTEHFPYYIWEQHVNSNIVPEKYKHYNTGLKGEYITAYEVMVEPKTGIPCIVHISKQGTHTMVNPATKDTATFKSLITLEQLYELKKPGDEE